MEVYPLVNIQKAIENGDRHSGFTDLRIEKYVMFHSYVAVYVVDLSNVVFLCGFHEMWFQSNVRIFG